MLTPVKPNAAAPSAAQVRLALEQIQRQEKARQQNNARVEKPNQLAMPADNTRVARPLAVERATRKPQYQPGAVEQYQIDQRNQQNRDREGYLEQGLGVPQLMLMKALTGTAQKPSDYLRQKSGELSVKEQNGWKGAALAVSSPIADVVVDPSNLLAGAGVGKKLLQNGNKLRGAGYIETALVEKRLAEAAKIMKAKAATPPVRQLLESAPPVKALTGDATRPSFVAEGAQPPLSPSALSRPAGVKETARRAGGQSAGPTREALLPSPRRDIHDVWLEDAENQAFQESSEIGEVLYQGQPDDVNLRAEAASRGLSYDSYRYNRESIARQHVAARSLRPGRGPDGLPLPPAIMQETARYTREANERAPGLLRTDRTRWEDYKAQKWANDETTREKFKKLAAGDGTGNVGERLTQFRQNIQFPLFETKLPAGISGVQFNNPNRTWLKRSLADDDFARTAEHEIGHASKLIDRDAASSLLPGEYHKLNKARLTTPRAQLADPAIPGYANGYYREPTEVLSRLREVRGALGKSHGENVGLSEFMAEMKNSHPQTWQSVNPYSLFTAVNRLPLSVFPAGAVGAGVAAQAGAKPQSKRSGGLLPRKHAKGGSLVMLAPDGTKQMELGGGNRIFSRKDTRELVTGSLKARDDKSLKELGKRVRQMLDQQDRNKPEYVKE